MKIIGIFLVIVGVLAFTYGGFSYMKKSRTFDTGPIQISWRENVRIPPVVGLAALIAGTVMLATASRRRNA